jgi:hypothetical protein
LGSKLLKTTQDSGIFGTAVFGEYQTGSKYLKRMVPRVRVQFEIEPILSKKAPVSVTVCRERKPDTDLGSKQLISKHLI